MKSKEWLVVFFFTVFLGAILYKLYFLQIKNGEQYLALSLGYLNQGEIKNFERGSIFFRGGEPLAVQKEIYCLSAFAPKLKDKKEVIAKLSQILQKDEKELKEQLDKGGYVVIKEDLSDKEIEMLKPLLKDWLYLIKIKKRYYPQKELAAQVVGFVDKEGKGRYGIEEFFDEELRQGKNVYLTLDFALQQEAQRILIENQKKYQYEKGEIIIVNPHSGEILAMAQYPHFDPNLYFQQKDFSLFKNQSTQELFEPGSVFKGVIFAAGLQENKITPETTYVDKGFWQIGGWRIENFAQKSYGRQTMTNVLEKSINTGAVFVQTLVGEKFLDWLEKLEFFQKTGVELPEIFSQNQELKSARPINLATASFGQGIDINSLHLVKFYSSIANGGFLIDPTIILGKEREKKLVFSSTTTESLRKMLISVVEQGYGKRAKIEGYKIGGKTGTAQIPFSKLGISQKGYSEKTIQSFVAIFPENPKFVVFVKIQNPITKTAEYSAVPIAREVIEFLINKFQIPPDY